ncbi:sugar O-acetyltransferase [Utexia brackfieldae]
MSEKEKMLSGQLYDANYDEQLIAERNQCKDLCFEFNQIKPSDIKAQQKVIRALFGQIKSTFTITAPFWCDYGYNIEIGDNFYTNHHCTILDAAKVTFGNNVFIAPNCGFYTSGHPVDAEKRNQGLEYAYPITVGDNVWIGAGVSVLPGVTIGCNSIIGAGSIVNRDIPANVVAAGNPCREVRSIADVDSCAKDK